MATAQTPSPGVSLEPLRIVLFGMPHAGKTWLLGALAEAAHSQQHRLHGRLVLVSKGLEQLRHEVYDQRAHRSTLGEIVPYDARYEPLDSATSAWEVTLIDCEGRRANELLAQARAWQAADRDGSLAQALLEADALLLVVDVADEPPQLDADFSQFHRFLQQLEEHRGRRAAVGGLPVWLVLTKCDLLAQPGDGAADWMERIEERKREVDRRFRAFRPGGSATELPAFGRIELHLWATAVMRPALGGIPAQPREPYGVAELFRHCFEEAAQFRRRCERSHRRLRATVLGLATGLVAMVFLAGAFALRHQTAPVRLETEVGHFRASEQAQPVGLRYRHVARKIEELAALQADPDFERLPQEQQDYVRDRLEELRAFEEFERRVNELTDPRDVAQEGQLHQLHEAVEQLAAFPGRRPEWDETEAGRRWQLWRTDTAALLAAVRQTREGYQRVLEEGVRVLLRKDEANLPSRARAVLDRCRQLPHPVQDRDRLIPGSRRLTYAGVFRFPTVAETVRRWDEEVRKKLELAAQLAS